MSIPAPAYYAHLVAFRARYHLVEREPDRYVCFFKNEERLLTEFLPFRLSQVDTESQSGQTAELTEYSGEGSHHSNGDERTPVALARAVVIHPDTYKVMYFA